MSVRAVWVIDAKERSVVFSRRFRTVERRARQLGGVQYHELASHDGMWAARILDELIASGEQNTAERCDRIDVDPVSFTRAHAPSVYPHPPTYFPVGDQHPTPDTNYWRLRVIIPILCVCVARDTQTHTLHMPKSGLSPYV